MIIARRKRIRKYISASASAFTIMLSVAAGTFQADSVEAETLYVQPSTEVVVRRGQGNDYKIVGIVKDGTAVELLEESDSYSLVRLDNGKEGWMLKRFLSSDRPLADLVSSLKIEMAHLQEKEMLATQAMQNLEDELAETKAELNTSIGERDLIRNDFDALRRDTADVVKIKDDLQKTLDENSQLAEKLAVIESENTSLKKDKAVNWFLAGAGVLFAGVLMGRLPKPTRRRKSSLLS